MDVVRTMGVKLVEELRMHYIVMIEKDRTGCLNFFFKDNDYKKTNKQIKTIFDDLRCRKELLHSSI